MLIKVATYNIHKAVGTDGLYAPDRILATLEEIGADVVVLQEADRRFGTRETVLPLARIVERTPYRPVVFGHNSASLGWHGNAALVSERLTVTASATLDLPTLEPRGAILIETLTDGHPMRIGGMHLDLTGLRRRQQARSVQAQVLARSTTMPTLLMGDLNEWRAARGCLIDFAENYHIAPTGPSFPARLPFGRLDRIMVGRGIEIVDCGTHRSSLSRVASDHLPVWATLRLSPNQSAVSLLCI
ncbi:endonuclease/exonuclease/phosphatase family protein [Glacieibacterium megasporae]|uniref:endonuclease/exonuclease/phosphatase family protein n=1 Tax=Glacieibacterium megasporae TaxID=2835787 RepID=UPI001C1E007C|nr:endonuclease/exonuclease/phosphatase family protein [Polymorphobacter megasporae]